MAEQTDLLQTTDDDARALARDLLRSTATSALATLDLIDGSPLATLVTVATDFDGAPLILVSGLSAHTHALRKDPRCSLLLARSGRGDPLAHPRLSLTLQAHFLEKNSPAHQQAAQRFLARHHKASLYVDFPDFRFVRLEPIRAALNGGFGRAFELTPNDLLCDVPDLERFAAAELAAVAHMNQDHLDAINDYACHLCKESAGDWRLTGIDPDGIDMMLNGLTARVAFKPALSSADQMRSRLVALVKRARAKT